MRDKIRKRALESYLREGDDVSQRIDWSLIFHAILAETFLAHKETFYAALPVGTLGLVAAIVWLFIGMRQFWHMRHLFDVVLASPDSENDIYVFHERLTNIRKGQPSLYRWVRATPFFTSVIPGATALTWSALLYFLVVSSHASLFWLALPCGAAGVALVLGFLLEERKKKLVPASAAMALYGSDEPSRLPVKAEHSASLDEEKKCVPVNTGAATGSDTRGSGTDSSQGQSAAKLRHIRSAYWLKRLDHTLNHTQGSSRLIYLIDAAVLALLYFAVQTFEPLERVVFVSAFPTLLLAVLNLLHARLITIQHSWYSGIDAKLRGLLDVTEVAHDKHRCFLASTHGVYRAIHLFIATFLGIAAVTMVLYGWGLIPEIKVTPKSDMPNKAAAGDGHHGVSQ